MNNSTQTLHQKLMEKGQELNAQIVELKARKECIEKEFESKLEEANALQARVTKLQYEIEQVEQRTETIAIDSQAIYELQNNILDFQALVLSNLEDNMKGLEKTINDTNNHLEELNKKCLEQHEKVVAETNKLINQKKDLDIYRSRLEKKCAEICPEIKIIL
ncbi:MAG: hypothetical protein PHW14_03585 [Candidatus Omnitrophica bacterium]|jgi:predicted  nucleic acid-binding Zn-ribbon protein|nr:hypothetical protein [Candidatus Omnitrophota bacterium]